jgi:phage terminase small subunit
MTAVTVPKSQTTKQSPEVQKLYRQRFQQFIEQNVLDVIQTLTNVPDTDPQMIQEIAQFTLNAIKPEMTVQEMFDAAIALDDAYPQLSPVVKNVLEEYEKTFSQPAVSAVQKMMQAGHYDKAQDVMQKVLSFKMQ